MFGAAGTRRLRDRVPYAGRNSRRPCSLNLLSCPAAGILRAAQVLLAFALTFPLLSVGRQPDCARRGWGVPLRDHTPLCRAQLPGGVQDVDVVAALNKAGLWRVWSSCGEQGRAMAWMW